MAGDPLSFEQYKPGTVPRAVPGISVTMPTPVVVDGLPTLPRYRGSSDSSGTALMGPNHIHSTAPDPPPGAGGNGGPGDVYGIWRVRDLPDPKNFNGGWYWLGARTGVDGSAGLPDACTLWPASAGSSPDAPAWHSRYPFKPSVVAASHWLWGGGTADHPRAVNFNSQFIEHMWIDLARDRPPPFTWLVVAMIPSYPYTDDFTQHILDAGRNPFDVGLPGGFGASDCYTPRHFDDQLDYRTILSATRTQLRASLSGKRGIQARHHTKLRPRMYFGVYAGANSIVGNFTSKQRYLHRGQLLGGAGAHRHTIIGRRANRLAQGSASHLLVFEIRYYPKALSPAELADVYDHVSSAYMFGRY